MIRKIIALGFVMFVVVPGLFAQKLIKAETIIKAGEEYKGELRLIQDPAIDTLLTRHIVASRKHGGFDGFRIQIYNGSKRNARELANEANSEFISKYPGIKSYLRFDPPNFFKVRVGNYRSKGDAIHDFQSIKKIFPNAYIVPDIIEFPELDE